MALREGAEMNQGDIVRMHSGRIARYEGGSEHGAFFTYLDKYGKPAIDPTSRNRHTDTVSIRSVRLLMDLQARVLHV